MTLQNQAASTPYRQIANLLKPHAATPTDATCAQLAPASLFAPNSPRHYHLQQALPVAEEIRAYLGVLSGIDETTLVGDCRRACPTVSEVSILATSNEPRTALNTLAADPAFSDTAFIDDRMLTLAGRYGLPVTVQFTTPDTRGAALSRLTGSRAHCAAVDRLATASNLRLTRHGVFRRGTGLAVFSESDVYDLLGLDWMAPELREDRGEIEAARGGYLPDLVEMAAIRGDLHCRPRTRGALTRLVYAARQRGYQYLAITLPAMDRESSRAWLKMIDSLQAQQEKPWLLKCVECRILEDGSLDVPDDILARIDLTICSVQSHFEGSQQQQTERLIRAMDHPAFNILAAAAKEQERRHYAVDLERVMIAARTRGCLLEIDNLPLHTELPDLRWRLAREIGVKLSLGSRAQRPEDLQNLHFGLLQARRGWLETAQVINTVPLEKLRTNLRR